MKGRRNNPFADRIRLKSVQGTHIIVKAQLVYLEADGNYTNFYILRNGAVKCIKQSGHLKLHEARLNDEFLRISHRQIVNLAFVAHISNNREVSITVPIDEKLIISRSYWKVIRPWL